MSRLRFAWRRRPREEQPLCVPAAEIMLAMHKADYDALCAIFALPDYAVFGTQAYVVAGVEESFEFLDTAMRQRPEPGRAEEDWLR